MDAGLREALPKKVSGNRVKSLFEIHKAAIEAALVETGLVYQGFQGENVVDGAVAGAEASLERGPDLVALGPLGDARAKNHSIEFGEHWTDRETPVIIWVQGVPFVFEDRVDDLAIERVGERAKENGGERGAEWGREFCCGVR
jgi:hypothetical protein